MLVPFTDAIWKLGNIIRMLLGGGKAPSGVAEKKLGRQIDGLLSHEWEHRKVPCCNLAANVSYQNWWLRGNFYFAFRSGITIAWLSLFSHLVRTKDEAWAAFQPKPPSQVRRILNFSLSSPLSSFAPPSPKADLHTKNSDDAVFAIIIFLITHSCLLLHNKRLAFKSNALFYRTRRNIQPE